MNKATIGAIAYLLPLLCTHDALAARGIHYGAVADPELRECDEAEWRGERERADSCYRALLSGTAPAAIRAEAAWALNDLQAANQLFRAAVHASPDVARLRVRWGDLFADSHQDGEAMNLYREAMELDDEDPFARLGAARVLAGGFDDAANSYLAPLVDDDGEAAGARVGALLLVARVALESGNRESAADALDRAEALIAAHDWPPLEVYALRASADVLDGNPDSDWIARSLQYNPHYGGIYAVPAHFYVITRRYREAIAMYQKAVDIEPDLAAAHEQLGVNLLRDNQVTRARRHLEIAHDVDPFSPVAVNTLRLLDSFDDFDILSDPPMPEPGVIPITMRLHEEESAAIAPYAIRLARDSIAQFTQRYGFELREPVVIEMYPDHEDFAVRTAGMPGLGILGATFGYVIAMDSPSSRPPAEFQWGTTLWHEMAHVFTLEATDHLVPRWFSEGVSVYEEWQSGPNPGVRIPMTVYNAMKDDRFLPIAELDEGFIRPTYEEQVIVSYMQAGLTCLFINERFGEAALRDTLYRYREGAGTAEAIEAVSGMTAREFDREFDDYIDREHGAFLERLQDWHQGQQRLMQAMAEGDWEGSLEPARVLIDMLPSYIEPDSPYLALARAQDELGRRDAARQTLLAFWRAGGYDPQALMRLAGWLVDDGDRNTAISVYDSVNLVDPLDQSLHGLLGDLLLDTGNAERALDEYQVALALAPHDIATANYRVARALHTLGRLEESRQYLLEALDVAPNYRPAQRLLLELMRGATPEADQT